MDFRSSIGQVFDLGPTTIDLLSNIAKLESELQGWSYQNNRDLTGFIDGSANPSQLEAAQISLIQLRSNGAGGSILLFQKWIHDTNSFRKLDVKLQEKIIGRTKELSEEFDDDQLSPPSHVARTTLVRNGSELPIFRRNVSFGTPSHHGTVFVGFSKEQSRLHEMLQRMVGMRTGQGMT